MDLTPQQITFLNQLRSRGFEIIAFPMYEQYVGVRKGGAPRSNVSRAWGKGHCGALLAPDGASGFKLYGEPSYLIGGLPSARMIQSNGHWFVRKREKIQATPERTAELDAFAAELANALLPVA
jgi:hypothetical protein